MKTMFLTLAAVLGIAIGIGSIPTAHASTYQFRPPCDCNG